jgi:hypothetical protein
MGSAAVQDPRIAQLLIPSTQGPFLPDGEHLAVPWSVFFSKLVQTFAVLKLQTQLFANLPSAATSEGRVAWVSDSTTNTWGQPISGGGPYQVMAFCDGSAWNVCQTFASPSAAFVAILSAMFNFNNLKITPAVFSSLPAPASNQGAVAVVSDSTQNTSGQPITGGGSFLVFAYCNGTNWVVIGV